MKENDWNILVGVTDHEEGADLSTHLINYGWNADHCYSAESVMDTLLEGDYGLVILDDEILADSEWTLDELADSLPQETGAILIGDPGSTYPFETFGDRIRVIIRPYTYSLLHTLVENLLCSSGSSDQAEEGEDFWNDDILDLGFSPDDLQEYVNV